MSENFSAHVVYGNESVCRAGNTVYIGVSFTHGDTLRPCKVEVARHYDDRFLNRDRKSTRLNSSHQISSYAVFCLKEKKREGRVWILLLVTASFLIAVDNELLL